MPAIWTEWDRTTELRRFDDTSKLTNPRLQQRWTRVRLDWSERESEWRDVPLVWEPDPNDVSSD